MPAWLAAVLKFLGLASTVADIVKAGQENARRDHDEKQGEQNANSKAAADTLTTLVNADRAADDPAIAQRVRERFERP